MVRSVVNALGESSKNRWPECQEKRRRKSSGTDAIYFSSRIVVRHISLTYFFSSYPEPVCNVARLSQTTRSPSRHFQTTVKAGAVMRASRSRTMPTEGSSRPSKSYLSSDVWSHGVPFGTTQQVLELKPYIALRPVAGCTSASGTRCGGFAARCSGVSVGYSGLRSWIFLSWCARLQMHSSPSNLSCSSGDSDAHPAAASAKQVWAPSAGAALQKKALPIGFLWR
mmetsp:Transcript_35691/g.92062  ORF Transcript_35691/g.92062 Transcript_35691/m.92062 type:complete len:225 (+) Transcript_35691:38-712(+)